MQTENASTLLDASSQLNSVIAACRLAEETASRVWQDEKRENDARRTNAVQASLAKTQQDKAAPYNEYLTECAEIKKRMDKLVEDYKAACARRQSIDDGLSKSRKAIDRLKKALDDYLAGLSEAGLSSCDLPSLPIVDFSQRVTVPVGEKTLDELTAEFEAQRKSLEAEEKEARSLFHERQKPMSDLHEQNLREIAEAHRQGELAAWQKYQASLAAIKRNEATALAAFTDKAS